MRLSRPPLQMQCKKGFNYHDHWWNNYVPSKWIPLSVIIFKGWRWVGHVCKIIVLCNLPDLTGFYGIRRWAVINRSCKIIFGELHVRAVMQTHALIEKESKGSAHAQIKRARERKLWLKRAKRTAIRWELSLSLWCSPCKNGRSIYGKIRRKYGPYKVGQNPHAVIRIRKLS